MGEGGYFFLQPVLSNPYGVFVLHNVAEKKPAASFRFLAPVRSAPLRFVHRISQLKFAPVKFALDRYAKERCAPERSEPGT